MKIVNEKNLKKVTEKIKFLSNFFDFRVIIEIKLKILRIPCSKSRNICEKANK